MFKQKNALIAVAVAVLLAACGGGGGDDNNAATTPDATSNPNTNNPAPTTGGQTGQTVADKAVAGNFTLAANQILVNGNLFDLAAFEAKAAPNVGIYSQARGTHAPLRAFGLRLMPENIPTTGASGNGHVAFEMKDAAANSQQEMHVSIDQVNYSINGSGWTVTVPATAKLYVHAKNSAGTAADVVVNGSLPAGLIALTDITGDPSSKGLVIDLDKAIEAAKGKATDAQRTVLNALGTTGQFKGTYNTSAVFSALTLRKTDLSALDTVSITVPNANQPAISGRGVKGKYWVETNPS
jgi:hypothetical protein